MLTISDFSEMCYLSPQTLRYYHAQGLLVPADVDPQTGYRSYTFEQVEQALLREHAAEVAVQRQLQDEAISDARELVTARPEVRLRQVPEVTGVSKLVLDASAGPDRYDWTVVEAVLGRAVDELVKTVESCGAVVSGAPWRSWARLTQEQQQGDGGLSWLVTVPVEVDPQAIAALPDDVEVRTYEARDELSILLPGKSSMAKFATALSRLTTHPLDGAYVDFSQMRQVLHDDGVETVMAVLELDEDAAVRARSSSTRTNPASLTTGMP